MVHQKLEADFRIALRSKYLRISPEAAEVINIYKLLQIGFSYKDLFILSADMEIKFSYLMPR